MKRHYPICTSTLRMYPASDPFGFKAFGLVKRTYQKPRIYETKAHVVSHGRGKTVAIILHDDGEHQMVLM